MPEGSRRHPPSHPARRGHGGAADPAHRAGPDLRGRTVKPEVERRAVLLAEADQLLVKARDLLPGLDKHLLIRLRQRKFYRRDRV